MLITIKINTQKIDSRSVQPGTHTVSGPNTDASVTFTVAGNGVIAHPASPIDMLTLRGVTLIVNGVTVAINAQALSGPRTPSKRRFRVGN